MNIYYKNTLVLTVFIATLGLSGCSIMNDKFSCQATAGDSCLSIDRVDAMYSDKTSPVKHASTKQKLSSARLIAKASTPITNNHRAQPRIWLAPWSDNNTYQHQAHYLEPHNGVHHEGAIKTVLRKIT